MEKSNIIRRTPDNEIRGRISLNLLKSGKIEVDFYGDLSTRDLRPSIVAIRRGMHDKRARDRRELKAKAELAAKHAQDTAKIQAEREAQIEKELREKIQQQSARIPVPRTKQKEN